MIYRLIVLNGPAKGQHITVDPEPVVIGRDPSCGIQLPDNEMALQHARLEQRDDDLFITDLGSMHKILLNKHETRQSRLKHGDIFELGRTRLLVQAVVRAEVHSAEEQPAELQHRGRKRKLALAASILLLAGVSFAIINSGRDEAETPEPVTAVEAGPVVNEAIAVETTEAGIDPEAPQAAGIVNPVPLDDELKRIREDLSSIQQHIQELNATSRIIGESAGTAGLPPVDDVDSAMKAAREAITAGKFDEAQLILEHLQLEYPDHLPGYQLRAELFEQMGMPGKAREQWTAILQRTAESELYRKAVTERIRLSRSESQTSISAHDALQIQSIDQMRFRETSDYDEMRSIKIQLQYKRQLGPIDPNAVRLVLYFFEQDVDTKHIALSKAQPYAQAVVNVPSEENNDLFVCTVSYVAPSGYYSRDHNTSRQRYYGFIARLHYFDQLVDEQARPAKLLDPAIMEAAGLAMHTAGSGSSDILAPASN